MLFRDIIPYSAIRICAQNHNREFRLPAVTADVVVEYRIVPVRVLMYVPIGNSAGRGINSARPLLTERAILPVSPFEGDET